MLDLTEEESQKRRKNRGADEDRMESEEQQFHIRVRNGFLKEAALHSDQWLVLDASQSPEALFDILMKELKRRKWLA